MRTCALASRLSASLTRPLRTFTVYLLPLTYYLKSQLQSIAFNAPGRNAAQQTQSAGFAFTVTGLDSGTAYDLTITAKNGFGSTLDTKTVSFTTESAQGINLITNDKLEMTNKILRDGQVLILRGNKTYTLTGTEIIVP